MRRSYRIGEGAFGVRTTSREFGAWLDDTLGAYRRRRSEWPEYSVVLDGGGEAKLHRGRRLHILYRGVGALVRTLELSRLGLTLLAELQARELAGRTDAGYVHAALLAIGDVNVLVPSWVPSYLSRLGRRVERAGVTLPAASWVGLDERGRVVPTELSLDVPADAVAALSAIDGSPPYELRVGPTAPVRVDAVCTYDEAIGGIEPGTRGVALYRLGGFAVNLHARGGQALEPVAELVAGASAFELGLGRAQLMLDALLALAEHERSRR